MNIMSFQPFNIKRSIENQLKLSNLLKFPILILKRKIIFNFYNVFQYCYKAHLYKKLNKHKSLGFSRLFCDYHNLETESLQIKSIASGHSFL
jgi:hypothetical protein